MASGPAITWPLPSPTVCRRSPPRWWWRRRRWRTTVRASCGRTGWCGRGRDQRRHIEAERLRGLEVDEQIDFHRTLNRQVSWPFAFQKTTREDAEFAKSVIHIGSVANERTLPDTFRIRDANWYLVANCQIDELVLNGEEEYFAAHQKGARLLLDKGCKGNNDIVGAAGFQHQQAQAEGLSRKPRFSRFSSGRDGIFRIDEKCNRG